MPDRALRGPFRLRLASACREAGGRRRGRPRRSHSPNPSPRRNHGPGRTPCSDASRPDQPPEPGCGNHRAGSQVAAASRPTVAGTRDDDARLLERPLRLAQGRAGGDHVVDDDQATRPRTVAAAGPQPRACRARWPPAPGRPDRPGPRAGRSTRSRRSTRAATPRRRSSPAAHRVSRSSGSWRRLADHRGVRRHRDQQQVDAPSAPASASTQPEHRGRQQRRRAAGPARGGACSLCATTRSRTASGVRRRRDREDQTGRASASARRANGAGAQRAAAGRAQRRTRARRTRCSRPPRTRSCQATTRSRDGAARPAPSRRARHAAARVAAAPVETRRVAGQPDEGRRAQSPRRPRPAPTGPATSSAWISPLASPRRTAPSARPGEAASEVPASNSMSTVGSRPDQVATSRRRRRARSRVVVADGRVSTATVVGSRHPSRDRVPQPARRLLQPDRLRSAASAVRRLADHPDQQQHVAEPATRRRGRPRGGCRPARAAAAVDGRRPRTARS